MTLGSSSLSSSLLQLSYLQKKKAPDQTSKAGREKIWYLCSHPSTPCVSLAHESLSPYAVLDNSQEKEILFALAALRFLEAPNSVILPKKNLMKFNILLSLPVSPTS